MQRKFSVNCFYYAKEVHHEKAIVLIPVCLIVGGIIYNIIQTHRVTAGLAGSLSSTVPFGDQ